MPAPHGHGGKCRLGDVPVETVWQTSDVLDSLLRLSIPDRRVSRRSTAHERAAHRAAGGHPADRAAARRACRRTARGRHATTHRWVRRRPPGFPNALVWLRAGILRDWRGVLGAFVATWFYLPVALLLAFWGGLSLAAVGLFAGGLGAHQMPAVLRDAPLIGPLLESFLSRSGGVLGGVVGFVVGFLVGFLSVLVLPWLGSTDGPFALFTVLVGMVAAAALIGVLYTLYRVLLEPRLLVVSGARQPSRRESARLARFWTSAPGGSACRACRGC